MFETYRLFPVAVLAGGLTCTPVQADTAKNSRAQVAAALKGMGEAANAHDVDRHVGFYAHDPHVTLIVDGEPIVGWDAKYRRDDFVDERTWNVAERQAPRKSFCRFFNMAKTSGRMAGRLFT